MKIVYVDPHEDPVAVRTHSRISDAVLAVHQKLLMACGGKGLCATCHIYVETNMQSLSPVTPREQDALAMLSSRKSNSRLACQAKVVGPNLVVALPEGLFIESSSDIEVLIGRRTEVAILHPVTGRVLIEAGMLISRSRISQLGQLAVDIEQLRARSESAL